MTGRRPDRILPFTRWLAIGILPFLAVASMLLYLFPSQTDRLFAWTIRPPLTAMFLGAAYLGGIWFFAQVLAQPRWHRVKHGFPAVVVFASLAGIATLLHLDRFHAGHVSFITWFVLYTTTPFLVLGALLANRSQDDGLPEARDFSLPLLPRLVIAGIGIVSLLSGAALFLAPEAFLAGWAWELTPLTARIVGAVLTLPGMVNVWLLVDPRWSAFRRIFQAQLFSLVFIEGALVVSSSDLEWSRPAAGIFVVGISLAALGYALFYLWCERRVRG